MSFLAYILLASFWAFAIWALSICCAKFFTSLSSWPEYWLAVIFVAFGVPVFAWVLNGVGLVSSASFITLAAITEAPFFGDIKVGVAAGDGFQLFLWAAYICGLTYLLIRLIAGWVWLARSASSGRREMYFGRNIIVTKNKVPLCAFGFFATRYFMPR